MKRVIFISIFVFILLGSIIVYADIPNVPDPTHKDISVENKITNLNDYPDYVFVTTGSFRGCSVALVNSEGLIPGSDGYRCSYQSVYAIKKSDFNENILNQSFDSYNYSDVAAFFNSPKAIRVLVGITNTESVPVTSTESVVHNEYKINLTQAIQSKDNSTITSNLTNPSNPDNQTVDTDYSFYFYILIPIIALIIVIYVLRRRSNKAKAKSKKKIK